MTPAARIDSSGGLGQGSFLDAVSAQRRTSSTQAGDRGGQGCSSGWYLSPRGCFTTSGDILDHPSRALNEEMLLTLMCRGQGILLIYRTIPHSNDHASGADVEKLPLLTNEAE